MKKSDLRTGWRLTNRDKTVFTVFLNAQASRYTSEDKIISFSGNHDSLGYYEEDLTNSAGFEHLDIIKVEIPKNYGDILNPNGSYETIWERIEPKEMTVEEIQEALGYKIKVVESKK